MTYLQGANRGQVSMLPACMEDYVSAMPPSRPEVPIPSYRHDEMPGTGRATIPAFRPTTKPCAPASASDGPTERNGPDITDEVAWRPR